MAKTKPVWPYKRTTPMTACGNGQWRRIHGGKPYYFGKWDEPAEALARWKREWPSIAQGDADDRPGIGGAATVYEVCTQYLAMCESRIALGTHSPRTLRAYNDVAKKLCKTVGAATRIEALGPRLFARALGEVAKTWGVHWRTNFVVYTRAIFKWAKESRIIRAAPDFGPDFKTAPRSAVRRHKQATRRTRLTPDDVILLIASAPPAMRLMIIMGISAGFGPTDVATLGAKDCDLNAGIINYARHKTAIPRVVPLWPHAIDLMRSLIKPGRDLVFMQDHGAPYNDERVIKGFRKLADSLNINATFYDLRRTFATVANGARDKDAARVIMGQRVESVFDDYVQDASPVPIERLLAVSSLVRSWLRLPHPSDPASKP